MNENRSGKLKSECQVVGSILTSSQNQIIIKSIKLQSKKQRRIMVILLELTSLCILIGYSFCIIKMSYEYSRYVSTQLSIFYHNRYQLMCFSVSFKPFYYVYYRLFIKDNRRYFVKIKNNLFSRGNNDDMKSQPISVCLFVCLLA